MLLGDGSQRTLHPRHAEHALGHWCFDEAGADGVRPDASRGIDGNENALERFYAAWVQAKGRSGFQFSANILASQAFVGGSNATIALFDTSAGASGVSEVGSGTSLAGASTPNYVAASPNGTYMFVADPGSNEVFIYNTLTAATTATTYSKGLSNIAGDTQAIAATPQTVPTTGVSPDDVYVAVANGGRDNLQVVDANPSSGTFGTVVESVTFGLGGDYPGSGPADLKVAPRFLVGGVPLRHLYVLRPGGDEICVFDVEPSRATFLQQLAAANAPNADGCVSLDSAGVVPKFIDISPDGLYAFVTETNGQTAGALKIINTDPNSATFETLMTTIDLATSQASITLSPNPADGTTVTFTGAVWAPVIPGSLEVVAGAIQCLDNGSGSFTGTGCQSGSINYATAAISITFTAAPTAGTLVQVSNDFVTSEPAQVRVSPDGQTVWVAGEDTGTLLGFETALVGSAQFAMVAGMHTSVPASDMPMGIAFRPDGAFGLATLSGSWEVVPFVAAGAGTPLYKIGVQTPSGIEHIPNAVLHITTSALPAATHGLPYASSIVADGPNGYFTFTDVTGGTNNLASLGLTLASDGKVTSSTATSIPNLPGTYPITVQVSDQSQPVNNIVVKTISLTIN